MTDEYQDGLREGRLRALEEITAKHDAQIDLVTRSIRGLERVVWALLGAIGLLQVLPLIQQVLGR